MKMELGLQDLRLQDLGRKVRNITSAGKLAIIVALNLAIFGCVFFFVLKPQFEEKDKLAAQYQSVKRDLDRMKEIKKNMPKYRDEFARLQEKLDEMVRQLPTSKDIPNLLRSVSAVGTESKVKVTYFEPGSIQAKEFYGEFPFKIRLNGPFHSIGYFFDGLRKVDRMISISDFSLAAKGSSRKVVVEGECMAKTYVYIGPPRGKGK